VRDASETTWWRKTRQLASATIGGAAVVGLLAVAADVPSGPFVFGLALPMFLAVVVAPLAILVAGFVFAARQQALDRRYDVAED
jgi:putative solute:sodium symporter small subunit